jgi:hypothetical protein
MTEHCLTLQAAVCMAQCFSDSAMPRACKCIQILFYCHFPDKLLCVDRSSLLKRCYRAPLDYIEEITTGQLAALYTLLVQLLAVVK